MGLAFCKFLQKIVHYLVMRTFILFCLFYSSLSLSNVQKPQERALCCFLNSNTCATYCAGRSCSATCSRRCGILLSDCGSVTCSSVASSTCIAAPTTAPATAPVPVPATRTCTAAGGICLEAGSTMSECCSGTECYPFGASGTAYCVSVSK